MKMCISNSKVVYICDARHSYCGTLEGTSVRIIFHALLSGIIIYIFVVSCNSLICIYLFFKIVDLLSNNTGFVEMN